uniref:Uncharacterized protein n=1 Tax=Meloidogyne enterolobii TaxID=390850 RepID=A0A6V7TYQ2_MELEN|nr:unnamed protein product [Meloidogyne enterolobii]
MSKRTSPRKSNTPLDFLVFFQRVGLIFWVLTSQLSLRRRCTTFISFIPSFYLSIALLLMFTAD